MRRRQQKTIDAAILYLERTGGPLPLDKVFELIGYGVDVAKLERETEEKAQHGEKNFQGLQKGG
jgi:hypothetical protein